MVHGIHVLAGVFISQLRDRLQRMQCRGKRPEEPAPQAQLLVLGDKRAA